MSLSIQGDNLAHTIRNKITIKNLKTKTEKSFIEHKEYIDFILYTPNFLISCAENIKIINDKNDKNEIKTASYVLCCALKGNNLVYCDGIGNVVLYDLVTNNSKLLFCKPYNTTDVYFICPKDQEQDERIVFCNIGIGIYNITTNTLEYFNDEYRGLGVSQDYALIATMDSKYNIVILNSQTKQVVKILEKGFHTRPVYAFCFDKNVLYTGGVDKVIYKWNLVTGKCINKVKTSNIVGSMAKHGNDLYYVDSELNQVKNF